MINYACTKEGMISEEVEICSIKKILPFALFGIVTILVPIALAFWKTFVASVIYFCIAFSYIFIVRLLKLMDLDGRDLTA